MFNETRKNPFVITFILWYTTEILFNTTLSEIAGIPISYLNNIINYLVLGLLLIQILFLQKYKLQEICIILIITIPIVISATLSTYFSLLSTWMFIVSAKKTDFEKIIHIAYKILLIMIPVVIILYFLGFIDDHILIRNGIMRYSLGFSHPNQLGLRIFQLVVCHCYLKRNNLRFGTFLYIILAALFVYFIPNSQTAYVCILVVLFLLISYKLLNRYGQVFFKIYTNCLIILTILFNFLSVLLSLINMSKTPILQQIDSWMSVRFSSCHRVLQTYGLSVWGQQIYISVDEQRLVGLPTTRLLHLDNAYMALILRFGIISYVIFSLAFIFSMIYFKERNYVILIIIFTVYALYGVMENGWFLTTHNIFLLAMSNLLYRKEIFELKHRRIIKVKFSTRRRLSKK